MDATLFAERSVARPERSRRYTIVPSRLFVPMALAKSAAQDDLGEARQASDTA